MIERVNIDLGDVRYPLYIGSGLLKQVLHLKGDFGIQGQPYIIIDTVIYEKYRVDVEMASQIIDAKIFLIRAGKSNKTFSTALSVFADMDKKNVSRDTTIIAIGGGVVGDLAGFIASCWYRGVKLIHIPTTLLSAVDSCLGGKTAINFRHTVNAIGTYHHPASIVIDTDLLHSLPDREISSGFGEIVKYSALGASQITSILEEGREKSLQKLGKLVSLCLREKEKFVRGDIKESSNRLSLNFGHTIGHAIEFSTVFNGAETLRHGEGVALGMVAIFRICVKLKMLNEGDVERLKSLLTMHGLPTCFNASSVDMRPQRLIEKVVELAFKDKKRTKQSLRLVVLNGWGNPDIISTDDAALVRLGVEEVIK